MAIVYDNLATTGLSGKIGRQLVFRTTKGRTIVSKHPTFTGIRSEAQVKQILRFREATIYAKRVLADEEIRRVYAEKAKQSPRLVSAYNLAIADYLHLPKIRKINLSGYHGQLCDMIVISAIDDFGVKGVLVKILRSDGSLLELGGAQPTVNGLDWVYYAQSENTSSAGCKVIISVSDFPGNVTVKEMVL